MGCQPTRQARQRLTEVGCATNSIGPGTESLWALSRPPQDVVHSTTVVAKSRRVVGILAAMLLLWGCSPVLHQSSPTGSGPTGSPSVTTVPESHPTTPSSVSTPPTSGSTSEPLPSTAAPSSSMVAPVLTLGSTGPAVTGLQDRLQSLHFWVGTVDGRFGDSTRQAVYAFQKAAGLKPDGAVGTATAAALGRGVTVPPRSTSGHLIEVDLHKGLLLLVDSGMAAWVFNTSTGGGYRYTEGGVTAVAVTPTGHFVLFRQVNGLVVSPLGELWRPKYFYSGFAIHGDSYVPPVPVSHGCVRVSNEGINWIWAQDLAPLGTAVWIY